MPDGPEFGAIVKHQDAPIHDKTPNLWWPRGLPWVSRGSIASGQHLIRCYGQARSTNVTAPIVEHA
jgi:hypothetical protein